MDKIKIKIDGRIAEIESAPEAVADNAEYEIDFALDPREGWDMSLPITALFVRRDGSYTARILDAGATSCTMPPQTGTNIVFVGLTQDDMRTTTPATIKVHRSIRTVAHDPLPEPTEDVYAQILAAYAGIKILSGKGAPTSATQGKVNQLYRDEDTQRLYICTSTDGGYTWAAVVSDTEDAVTYTAQTLTEEQKTQARANIGAGTSNFSGSYNDLNDQPNIPAATVIDTTLTKSGQAADAKAAGDAIGKKIDAPQVAQVGEVLTVEEVDEDGKPKKWKTSPAAAKQKQADWNQNDETAADYVKNRPFYSKLEKQTFVIDAGKQASFYGIAINNGDRVDITVDGQVTSIIANDATYSGVQYTYIGDTIEELFSGTGSYGWTCYIIDKDAGLYTITSASNHVFECDAFVDYRLPLKYSPISITSYGTSEGGADYSDPVAIDEVFFDRSFYGYEIDRIKGIIYENNGSIRLKLTGVGRDGSLKKYKQIDVGIVTIASTTINTEYKSTILKDRIDDDTKKIIASRIMIHDVSLQLSEIRINKISYIVSLSLAGECLTGTFLTVDGYLYSVIVKFNSSSYTTRFDQNWTLIVKRIL